MWIKVPATYSNWHSVLIIVVILCDINGFNYRFLDKLHLQAVNRFDFRAYPDFNLSLSRSLPAIYIAYYESLIYIVSQHFLHAVYYAAKMPRLLSVPVVWAVYEQLPWLPVTPHIGVVGSQSVKHYLTIDKESLLGKVPKVLPKFEVDHHKVFFNEDIRGELKVYLGRWLKHKGCGVLTRVYLPRAIWGEESDLQEIGLNEELTNHGHYDVLILNYPDWLEVIDAGNWVIFEYVVLIREVSVVTWNPNIYLTSCLSKTLTNEVGWRGKAIHEVLIEGDYSCWELFSRVRFVCKLTDLSDAGLIIEILIANSQVGVAECKTSCRIHMRHYLFVTVAEY